MTGLAQPYPGSIKSLQSIRPTSNNFEENKHLPHEILGDRPTAGLRTLAPPMEVRILLPQPVPK